MMIRTTILALASLVTAAAQPYSLVGELKKVETGTKKIVVKTAEGTEETFKFTQKAGKAAALEAMKGTTVMVKYTGVGAEKTVLGVKHLRSVKGALVKVDHAAGYVVVKTERGVKETIYLTEVTAKEGEHVTVHYTAEAGRKVGHILKIT